MTYLTCRSVVGFGGYRFGFKAEKKHGKGTQTIEVSVPVETIKRLASILEYTESAGHAAWHFNSPDDPLPCGQCELVNGWFRLLQVPQL
ncbi:MAG: hypothetical protein Q7R68_10840 [Nitrospirales bacterium]|nr:hypothetical protein [Nitrospirales bacterium]